MITYLGSGPFGIRLTALSLTVHAGIPSTEFLFVSAEFAVAGKNQGRQADVQAANHETKVERAFLAEWDALCHALDVGLLESVGNWLDEKDVTAALVRSEKGSGLGTALAAGRAGILRALTEVRAAALYDQEMDGTPPSFMIARVPHGSQVEVCTAGRSGRGTPWVARLQAEHGIESSIWAFIDGEGVLIDAGGPVIDPNNPWTVLKGEPVEQRAMLGRVFNRVCEKRRPFDWVKLLTSGGDEDQFLQECRLRYPDVAQRLLDAAVETMEIADPDGDPFESDAEENAGSPGRVSARQVIGLPGNAGEAAGIVTYDPQAAGGKILFCDRVTARIWRMKPKAAAIVERGGAGFGHGAILAYELGIPHIYGVADLQLISEGMSVSVNGELGIVIANTRP